VHRRGMVATPARVPTLPCRRSGPD
jgi:hypothetical protein